MKTINLVNPKLGDFEVFSSLHDEITLISKENGKTLKLSEAIDIKNERVTILTSIDQSEIAARIANNLYKIYDSKGWIKELRVSIVLLEDFLNRYHPISQYVFSHLYDEAIDTNFVNVCVYGENLKSGKTIIEDGQKTYVARSLSIIHDYARYIKDTHKKSWKSDNDLWSLVWITPKVFNKIGSLGYFEDLFYENGMLIASSMQDLKSYHGNAISYTIDKIFMVCLEEAPKPTILNILENEKKYFTLSKDLKLEILSPHPIFEYTAITDLGYKLVVPDVYSYTLSKVSPENQPKNFEILKTKLGEDL